MSSLRVDVLQSLRDVRPLEWDALCGDDDPFIQHAFLLALEESGSVGSGTGWLPCHVVVRDEADRLRGAAPLYLKDHSYGEYIFDWAWADASQRAGVPYYPKLVSAVPFTPVTGQRLLVADDPASGAATTDAAGRETVVAALVEGVRELADRCEAWSIHWLFLTQQQHELLAARHDFAGRLTYQFHWTNEGYGSFEDYLAAFRHGTRKSVRRERKAAQKCGLALSMQRGDELEEADWAALYRFYRSTTDRKWGEAYLTPTFFDLVRKRLGHCTYVALARQGDAPVAGALFFHRGQHLYGRYWGCDVQADALHFELCYYLPIELCISQGWQRFEAGAQGMHKIRRGLLPAATYSAHWLRHPGLRAGVEHYLKREEQATLQEIALLSQHSPFRRT